MSLVVTGLWFAFILSYTGRESFLTPRRFGVASAPLAVGARVYFVAPSWPPLVDQLRQTTIPAGTVVEASIGPLGGVLGVYLYLIFLVGLGVASKTALEGNSVFTGQAAALVVGSLVTILASVLKIAGVPTRGYPTTEVALAGQSMLWGYAVFGQQFLRMIPAVATISERVVFDELDDAVIVVDDSGTVTRANRRAESYLDLDGIVGEPAEPLLNRMGVGALSELPTRFELGGQTYQAKASPIMNWRDDTIGQAVVVQDVTSLVRRQQRLQVLNRILRHNVRNSMNVVLGMSERLQGRSDDDLSAIGETVGQQVESLVSISDKALKLDQVLDGPVTVERTDLRSLTEEIVASVAPRNPDAEITTDISVDEVNTDRRILSLVVEEVLSNAVEHSGDAPEVSVDIVRRNGYTEIAVTDDGPGIPRSEIDPVVSGEETDLRHASSLGLWLVYRGTQSLGGDVDTTVTEEGSTVTLSLPELDRGGTAAGHAAA